MTLEEKFYAYLYGENSVNWPQRHAEAMARIAEEHYADGEA